MINPRKTTVEMMELYNQGYSFEDIGQMFGLSRQAVWERLSRRKEFSSRKKKVLPFVIVDGIKFTPSGNGYYRATFRHKHLSLHRYIYEKAYGELPEDWDVHHIDEDKQNNDLSNLQAMSKADHARLHMEKKNENN